MSPSSLGALSGISRPSLQGHLEIARIDHWFKNAFVLPGIAAALSMDPWFIPPGLTWRIVIGLLAICLVASSNYVINEVIDAPFDRYHPTKCKRPVPSGRVSIRLAYVQWFVLMMVGIGLGLTISIPYALTLLALWGMGCIYNIPPLRSKDAPYVDVLSEAVNNPLRMLAGWFIAGTTLMPPVSLVLSYWMIGCYFMALKRFAEYRDIHDHDRAASYRKSFAFYSEERLMTSVVFYGSTAMLFFGAFIMRYRLELIVSFPLVALVMATYLGLAYKENSAAQRPEGLYREPILMGVVFICIVAIVLLFFIDIPILHRIFIPTVRTLNFAGVP
jgi:4-hydroxybenzoate polyprenyltransferase